MSKYIEELQRLQPAHFDLRHMQSVRQARKITDTSRYIDQYIHQHVPEQITDPVALPDVRVVFRELGDSFPGMPEIEWRGGKTPPPDALAFYLPYHFFHWPQCGVYLLVDGIRWLARHLTMSCSQVVDPALVWNSAWRFLYYHELFHHYVERFSTWLEVVHRRPLYISHFRDLYLAQRGQPVLGEEGLATAYGVRQAMMKLTVPEDEKEQIRDALTRYVASCPVGYREGAQCITDESFNESLFEFMENNHSRIANGMSRPQPQAWLAFPNILDSRLDGRLSVGVFLL